MQGQRGELDLLSLHRRTTFVFDDRGRMVHETAPDRSRDKRIALSGCAEGNVVAIRDDLPDAVGDELEELLRQEPPLLAADRELRYLADYLRLCSLDGIVPLVQKGWLWVFPSAVRSAECDVVSSGTSGAEDLLERFDTAISPDLVIRGFTDRSAVWDPWCAALVDGQIVAIAETVRSGPDGAEVGVDTASGFRGRGLGAAVTAAWSQHPGLEGRTLFYGTDIHNRSSIRVTERLGLRLVGSLFALRDPPESPNRQGQPSRDGHEGSTRA
jgi:GNAT acetyltransferase